MSADFVLYAVAPHADSNVLDAIAAVTNVTTIYWPDDDPPGDDPMALSSSQYTRHWDLISASEDRNEVSRQWIGQVSWLKAGLLGDVQRFVPPAVATISRLVDDTPVLTRELRGAIMVSFNRPDRSIYSRRARRERFRIAARATGKMGRDWAKSPYPGGRRDRHVYAGTVKPQHLRSWLDERIGWTLYGVSE